MNTLGLTKFFPNFQNIWINCWPFKSKFTISDHLIKTYLSQYDSYVSTIDPINGPYRLGDIPHSFACIDKAKLLLGYKPLVLFREGLISTIEWYVNNHI